MQDFRDQVIAVETPEHQAEERGADQDEEDHRGDMRGTLERGHQLRRLAQDEQARDERREENEAGDRRQPHARGREARMRDVAHPQVERVAQDENDRKAEQAGDHDGRKAATSVAGEAKAGKQEGTARADRRRFRRRRDAAED